MKKLLYILIFLSSRLPFGYCQDPAPLLDKITKMPDDTNKTLMIAKLVDIYLEKNDFEKSLEWINKNFTLSRKLNFQIGIATSTYRLGRYYEELNDLVKADSIFKVAAVEYSNIKNNEKRRIKGIIGVNFSRAGIISKLGMLKEAEKTYLENIKYAETLKDTTLLAALCANLLTTYIDRNLEKEAYELRMKIEKIFEKWSEKTDRYKLINNIGLMEMNHGNIKQAKENFYQSLELARSIKGQTSLMQMNLGSCFFFEKKYKEGLSMINEAIKQATIEGEQRNLGLCYGNLGDYYRDKGNSDSALFYYKKTIPIFENTYEDDGLSTSLRNIGSIYNDRGNSSESIKYLLRSYEIAQQKQLPKNTLEALKSLALVYEKNNDYKSAFNYHKLYVSLKDTLNDQSKKEELNLLKTKNALEKQEAMMNEKAQIEKAKAEAISAEKINREAQKKIFSLIALAIFAVFVVILFGRFRIIKRQKNIIEKQKALVDEKQKEILDSINYAKRIQQSLIPSEKVFAIKLGRHTDNEKP